MTKINTNSARSWREPGQKVPPIKCKHQWNVCRQVINSAADDAAGLAVTNKMTKHKRL